jgi:hypothetical protein
MLLGNSDTELLVGWDSNKTVQAEKYGGVVLKMNGVSVQWVIDERGECAVGH